MIQSSLPLASASPYLASEAYDNNGYAYRETSFKSIFRYSSLPTDENNFIFNGPDQCDSLTGDFKSKSLSESFLRKLILSAALLAILLTFPISIWFTVKRIKPLERCIIYRLGKRLPLKGPGLIIVIPLVDVVDFIDLNPQRLVVLEREQFLTLDGSLVELDTFLVEMTVSNAIRTSTQLKDSRANVEQFIKLSFSNTIGGAHVEDLERKMEFLVKRYEETCNHYINKWGWSMVTIQQPRVRVISRSEPVNNVFRALKGYFGLTDGQIAHSPAGNLINTLSTASNVNPTKDAKPSDRGTSSSSTATITQSNINNGPIGDNHQRPEEQLLLIKLRNIGEQYKYLSKLGINNVSIDLQIGEDKSSSHYSFNTRTGHFTRTQLKPGERPQIIIQSASWAHFNEAVNTKDLSKVTIVNNLI